MSEANGKWRNRIVGYEDVSVDELTANPANWRIHPQHQQDSLLGVLHDVGIVQNIIVNQRSGYVVDGHMRVLLAMKENQATVPVTYVDLSDAEEALVLSSIDPISALAVADKEKLDALLKQVSTDSPALQEMLANLATEAGLYLNGDKPPEDKGAQTDRATELQQEYGTEVGQLWEIGKHRLLIDDCTIAENVERLMGGERADAVVTDFPYNIGKDYGVWDDSLSSGDFWDKVVPSWIKNIAAVLCEPSHFITTFSERGLIQFIQTATKEGFVHRHTGVWHNPNRKAGSYPGQWPFAWEPILDFSFGGWRKLNNSNGVGYSDVWVLESPITADESKPYHPAEKPLQLYVDLIKLVTETNELIFEPFSGSGTTLIGCEQSKRICFTTEISPSFAAVTIKRWEDMTGHKAILTPAARE